MIRKLLSLVLVFALASTLFALPAIAAEEPITITVISPYSSAASSDEGYKMVQDWILENTGVLVNSIQLDGSNDTEKKNLLLTGNQLIDVWWGDWMTYAENGMVRPINDLLDQLPNVVKGWEHFDGAWNLVTDSEGTVWGLPRVMNRVFYQTFVREDWLKALGYAEQDYPDTFEKLEKFLYAVKEADPYGNSETIPLITRKGIGNLEYHFLGGFTKWGVSNWMDEKDGLIKPQYLQDGYYDFLLKMNQWYKDGIIHAENPTWDTATVQSYLASGRVAVSGAYGTDCCRQAVTLRANYPEADYWAAENGVIGLNGELCETMIKGESTACLINANSPEENVQAFVKVMEFLFSDWANNYSCETGPQGVYWDYDTENYGDDAYTKHIVKDLTTEPVYNGAFWFTIGAMEWDTVMYDADGRQNMQNEYIRHQQDLWAAKAPYDINVSFNTNKLYENVFAAADIKTMADEQIVKFFTGERELNEDEWSKFIDELYAAGMQEYCEELTRQYKEVKGIE